MLTLTGTLLNTFKSPVGTNKDGESYGGQDKIQILGKVELPNGESKNDLITLTTHNLEHFENLDGVSIRVPVGVFVNGKVASFFIPKGSKPESF